MSTKVYITKWALTQGILALETKDETCHRSIRTEPSGCYLRSYFWKDEWHLTYAAAVARAEEMRTKKIESLRKSLSKMEALTFEEEPTEERSTHASQSE